ncbi:hypothetical protein [Limosilactobacillus reuteri]|uniref:hypothetical protein n=1 Tax=Limosilactobacillus reuteri TaxID=1598 RepID=UPI00109471AE|nr:hypothetical protein [Limosilactobacillus reuteri]TGY63990.1 hypothetical protein E5337_03855 [Limosilactobacillus reuteri]
MKKIGLICTAIIACIVLSGYNNLASQEMHKKSAESSSVKKHHTHDEDQDDDFSLNLVSSDDQDTDSNDLDINVPSANISTSSASNIQVPHFNSNGTGSPTSGGDPKVQAETASIQHDWNVKQGIENPDGSETQNFKNWVSKRDQAEANGQSMPEYDQNQRY